MAVPTKTRTVIWLAQNLISGAANLTSASINLSAAFEANLDIKLTNLSTGPTIPAQVQIQVANDAAGTLWTSYGGAFVGTSANSDVQYFSVTIPIGVAAIRLVAGSNTGQNVTADADISIVTAIA
jgi:hypothetical protein